MGCDIHCYKEKFVGGKWVTADEWVPYDYGDDERGMEVPFTKRFTDRNYELFGILSKGVRLDHAFSFEQRGLPFNLCAEISAEVDCYGSDGHSHSYLYLHELKDLAAHLKATKIRISGMKDKAELDALNSSVASGNPNWNLLFPYCQSTNAPGSVDFEIDVPASFYVGDAVDRLIAGFDDVDGENHRLVFWFDN